MKNSLGSCGLFCAAIEFRPPGDRNEVIDVGKFDADLRKGFFLGCKLKLGPVFKGEYVVIDEADMLELIHGRTTVVKARIVQDGYFPEEVVFPLLDVRDVARKELMLEAMKSSTLSFLDPPVDVQAIYELQQQPDIVQVLAEDAAVVPNHQEGGSSGSAAVDPPKAAEELLRGGGANLEGLPVRRLTTSLRPTDMPPEIWRRLKGAQRELYLASYSAGAAIQKNLDNARSLKQLLDQSATDSVKHVPPLFLDFVRR